MDCSFGRQSANGINLFDWAKGGTERGREILFTSMDNDGTKNGFANEALSKLSSVVNIPIIASGGVTTTFLLIALQ
jgi:cyclase